MTTSEERVRFAEALMEDAEHSSEIAMRASLSRAYYAVHHVGVAVTGSTDHGTIRNRLRALDPDLGAAYGHLLERRAKVDYDPTLTSFEPKGLERFRETFKEDMVRARVLLESLKRRV